MSEDSDVGSQHQSSVVPISEMEKYRYMLSGAGQANIGPIKFLDFWSFILAANKKSKILKMAHDVAPILNRAPLQSWPVIRIWPAGSSASDWLATRGKSMDLEVAGIMRRQ